MNEMEESMIVSFLRTGADSGFEHTLSAISVPSAQTELPLHPQSKNQKKKKHIVSYYKEDYAKICLNCTQIQCKGEERCFKRERKRQENE